LRGGVHHQQKTTIKKRCPSPIEYKNEEEALIDKRKEQSRGYGD
jgi:hypothetical protein